MKTLFKKLGLEWHVTFDDYLVVKMGDTVRLFPLWKLTLDNMLKTLSLRPVKVFRLKTGVTIKHYRNGRIKVQPRANRQG